MKHLNPRQGITTEALLAEAFPGRVESVKHLNPRQGITTTYGAMVAAIDWIGVKHLNPRQGITTGGGERGSCTSWRRVKHLNPRQGITTEVARADVLRRVGDECETPKSPPGDYNLRRKATRTISASATV